MWTRGAIQTRIIFLVKSYRRINYGLVRPILPSLVQYGSIWQHDYVAKERKFFKDNIGVVQSEDDEVATVPRTKKHRVGPPKTEPKAEASTSSKKGKGKAPEVRPPLFEAVPFQLFTNISSQVSDSEDDTPLAKLPLKKADPIQKRKRTVVFSDDGSQASSESDVRSSVSTFLTH